MAGGGPRMGRAQGRGKIVMNERHQDDAETIQAQAQAASSQKSWSEAMSVISY